MARSVNQVLWGEWRQRMERQRESGLSIAEFCRREKLSRHSFHVWKRKLDGRTVARRRSGEPARAQGTRRRRARVTSRRRLRRESVLAATPSPLPGFLQLPVTAVRPSPWIELALADGTVVRLPQQNVAALVTVLRVLRGERMELPGEEHGHA